MQTLHSYVANKSNYIIVFLDTVGSHWFAFDFSINLNHKIDHTRN